MICFGGVDFQFLMGFGKQSFAIEIEAWFVFNYIMYWAFMLEATVEDVN